MNTLKINGHHIYSYEQIVPFLYRFRIGTGPWRFSLNGTYVQDICHFARNLVIDAIKRSWT
jgi:hypothetical protein